MIVDLIIIGIIVLGAIIGRFRGLASALLNIFSFILAISLALYAPVESALIKNTTIDDKINETIYSKLEISISNDNKEDSQNNEENNEQQEQKEQKEQKENQDNKGSKEKNTKLPKILQKYIDDATKSVETSTNEALKKASEEITKKIMDVISFIIVFIGVRILLVVLKLITKIITKLPVIKQIDHIGGFICGLIESIMVIYLAFAIISVVSPTIKNEEMLKQIDNSFIGSRMYNNNIILRKIY